MPINVNGTKITDVKVNGVSMNEVKVNGVVVWTRNLDLNLLNDAASAYTVTYDNGGTVSFRKNSYGQFVFTFTTPNWDNSSGFSYYAKRKTAIDMTKYSKLNIGGALSDTSGSTRFFVIIYRSSDNALLSRTEIATTTGSFSKSISLSSINTSCYIEFWGWDTRGNKTHTLTISTFKLVI